MQLDPDTGYALGGPLTPDQRALILTHPADHQERALELAQLPETDRPAEPAFPNPPEEEDDHDACPYRTGT